MKTETYKFKVADPSIVDVERIFAENRGALALIIGNRLFLHVDFLKRFTCADSVIVAGEPLQPEWGYLTIPSEWCAIQQHRETIKLVGGQDRKSSYTTAVYRQRRVDLPGKQVLEQVLRADQYRRCLTVEVVALREGEDE